MYLLGDMVDLPESHSDFVEAGINASRGDISGNLALEKLNDGQKLNFIDDACTELRPLSSESMLNHLGKIMFLELPRTLKTQTMVILLDKGLFIPDAFTLVRQWLIGTLADMSTIRWERRDGVVEIMGESTDYAGWYIDISTLYRECRKHMTSDFIKKERHLIGRHPLLPTDVQQKILELLD